MSAALEKLRATWRKRGILAAVERALDRIGFTDTYVDALANHGREWRAEKSKVIKDNVWGMIEVEASSLRLLDSPLVQRLRGIHQLGLTYLTYPSAEHSRFIHSLGMYSVVSRFLDVMERQRSDLRLPGATYRRFAPEERIQRTLKHAAILHDCGHLPYSHVTEQVFEADNGAFKCGPSSVDDFKLPVHDNLQTSSKLAECLSIAITLTDRFRRFYLSWVDPTARSDDVKLIAGVISGSRNIGELTGISNLISGTSIDADKIDYINRDGAVCGIPVGVDVSRLFLRSNFLELTAAERMRLQSLENSPDRGEIIFVVNASGLDSIEEMVQARTALYHRVYLHQTTRNAERLLGLAIHADASLRENDFARGQRRFRDALNLWSLNDVQLMDALVTSTRDRARELARRIRNRQFPKRASTFGRAHLISSFPAAAVLPKIRSEDLKILEKELLGTVLEDLGADKLFGPSQRSLEQTIAVEARRLARLLNKNGWQLPEGVNVAGPGLVSVLPMPNLEANRSDCIVLEGEELVASSAASITDEQMEATDISKARGYVLADQPWRELTFIATRAVLFNLESQIYDIRLAANAGVPPLTVKAKPRILLKFDSTARRVGLDRRRLGELQGAAIDFGYYDEMPQLAGLQVPPERISKISKILQPFCGQGNWSVTDETVGAFLSQFPPKLAEKMAILLSRFTMLDRSRLATDIGPMVRALPLENQKGYVVALSPDSGNAVRMQLEQELRTALTGTGWEFAKSIRDALRSAKAGDRIVFCDDNVSSGWQAVCQFKVWLDSPMTAEEKLEQGIELTPLEPDAEQSLRSVVVHIVTSAGTKEGSAYVQKHLGGLGISFQGLSYAREVKETAVTLGPLDPFLKQVGEQVLAWSRHGVEDIRKLPARESKACERDAVGYDGARALICTPMNVPVSTVTALWCPGLFNSRPWVPLLIRRGYLAKLVLS